MHAVAVLLARAESAERERERADAALASRFASRFNPVALLAPGETRLSSVLRWMLDDRETHGQGGVFRDLFVAAFTPDDPHMWAGARVACEVATEDGGGRMDLMVESADGSRCIVVENKPWAGWQARQLLRYLEDQRPRRSAVHVLALVGAHDPDEEVRRHWAEHDGDPLPPEVGAAGFDAVAAWLDACAAAARADRVRAFLLDLAGYCRRVILSEPVMSNDTADLILAGGADALRAAHAISAALPLAMTREVARRAGGAVEQVGSSLVVRIRVDDVPVAFALFGVGAPWAGLTSGQDVTALRGVLSWGRVERLWPRWAYLKQIGPEGRELASAVSTGDCDAAAALIPSVARMLIGAVPQGLS